MRKNGRATTAVKRQSMRILRVLIKKQVWIKEFGRNVWYSHTSNLWYDARGTCDFRPNVIANMSYESNYYNYKKRNV